MQEVFLLMTSEDLNEVKILEKVSGEGHRPAIRETRTVVSVSDSRAGRARRDCQERLGREWGENRPASEATRETREVLNEVKILEKASGGARRDSRARSRGNLEASHD